MTTNSTRILGSLRTADGKGVVRIEDRYHTAIDDLWSAITEPSRLARWYGEVEGDLRPGGEFHEHLEAAGIHAVGRVAACEPPYRLRIVSRETDESFEQGEGVPPFDETIEATLRTDGEETVLVIEASGMPRDKVAFWGVGWQVHAENLAAYVAGRQPLDDQTRWGELVPPYQELASRIE